MVLNALFSFNTRGRVWWKQETGGPKTGNPSLHHLVLAPRKLMLAGVFLLYPQVIDLVDQKTSLDRVLRVCSIS